MTDLHDLRARVRTLLVMGRLDEAARLAREGLATEPGDAHLMSDLARALIRSEPAEARRVSTQAVAAAPDDPQVLQTAARVMADTGKAKEAVRLGERARTLDPFDANVHLVLSQAYDETGRIKQAVASADEVIRLAPMSAAGFVERSRLSLKARDPAGCERWAREALRVEPGNSAALNNLAVALEARGRRTEAIDLFARAAAAEASQGGGSRSASNARSSARSLGGIAFGGIALYLVSRVVILAFSASVGAGLLVLVALLGGYWVFREVRYRRDVEELAPHLQQFVRDERAAVRRDPRRWLGDNPREVLGRAIGILVIVAVVVLSIRERDESSSDSPPSTIDPQVLECIRAGSSIEDCR